MLNSNTGHSSCELPTQQHAVLLQGNASQAQPPSGLPALPANARYVYHPNECYDWGTVGWLLQSGLVQPSKYK